MSAHHRMYLRYVSNTNGGATVTHFIEDFAPVGGAIFQEILFLGFVTVDGTCIRLTEKGKRELEEVKP